MKSKNSKHGYRRSTPVIRLRRNVEKLAKHAELCRERLAAWKASKHPVVDKALEAVTLLEGVVCQVDSLVGELERTGFVPPRKVVVWQPAPGDVVRVADHYLSQFLEIYADVVRDDPDMPNELVVQKCTTKGGVVVQRRKKMPLAVRKSHLVLVSRPTV